MSQKKVDAYKQKKIHKGKATGKERVTDILEMAAWVFICVAMVAWIGYSAYAKMTGSAEKVIVNTAMDTTALDNYLSNLSVASDDAEEGTVVAEEDTAEETEAADEAAAEETDTAAESDSEQADDAETAEDETVDSEEAADSE